MEVPSKAVMVAVVEALTADVCIVKVADVEPEETVTEPETVAAGLVEEMETTSPDVPAGPAS